MVMADLEKSEKLPPDKRYFNISILWILYFRHVIRLLYHLKIPHEIVTLMSILSGLVSAGLFYSGYFILAAVALHFKDVFDACDGALARLTGRGHLIGRYLDSLGDFVTLTLVIGAIALRAMENISTAYLAWGILAVLSTFIQCSFFNYYQLAYLDTFGIKTLSSRRDERSRDDLDRFSNNRSARAFLAGLRLFYLIVYGWQDRLVASVDGKMFRGSPLNDNMERFGRRSLMVMQSALCFGTHIFVIILFSVFQKPWLGLIFIGIPMNLYLIFLLYLRKRYYRTRVGLPAGGE